MKPWIVLISLLAALPVSARIGETKEQLIARYGEPRPESNGDSLVFRKNGISIEAILWKGVCHLIVYSGESEQRQPRPRRMNPSPPGVPGAVNPPPVIPGLPKDTPEEPDVPASWKSPLSMAQIQKLVELNFGNSTWISKINRKWETEDGSRFATADGNTLTISTKEYVDFKEAELKNEELKRIEGF